MISPKEIKALARAMHSCGIVSLETPEVKLIIQPKPAQVRRKRKNPMLDLPSTPTGNSKGFGGYTEEQLLSWSSSPIGDEDAQSNP